MTTEQPMSKQETISYCKYLWETPTLLPPRTNDCIQWFKTVFNVPPYPNMNEMDVVKAIAELYVEEEEDLYRVYDDEGINSGHMRRQYEED